MGDGRARAGAFAVCAGCSWAAPAGSPAGSGRAAPVWPVTVSNGTTPAPPRTEQHGRLRGGQARRAADDQRRGDHSGPTSWPRVAGTGRHPSRRQDLAHGMRGRRPARGRRLWRHGRVPRGCGPPGGSPAHDRCLHIGCRRATGRPIGHAGSQDRAVGVDADPGRAPSQLFRYPESAFRSAEPDCRDGCDRWSRATGVVRRAGEISRLPPCAPSRWASVADEHRDQSQLIRANRTRDDKIAFERPLRH